MSALAQWWREREVLRREPEVIGDPACPILYRWTLLDIGKPVTRGGLGEPSSFGFKLMVHHFLPNADDRDVHDHPRPFITFVLRGGYEDWVRCPCCGGARENCACSGARCGFCFDDGIVLGDRMRPGTIKLRRATHAHRTKVSPDGCWTIVVMGPLQRAWGFWIGGKWWGLRDYESEFGFGMRCGDEEAS